MKLRFQPARPRAKRPVTKSPRQGASKEEICFGIAASSLGLVLVAVSEKGVVSVRVGESENQLFRGLEQQFPKAHLVDESRDLQELLDRVVAEIEAPTGRLDLPLDLRGTAFRQKVWNAVRNIPLGQTRTYSDIAREIGADKAVRAVGSACSESPMAVIIPCHRVLRKDGSVMEGSFWGNLGQRALLDRESDIAARRPAIAPGGRRRSPDANPTPRDEKNFSSPLNSLT